MCQTPLLSDYLPLSDLYGPVNGLTDTHIQASTITHIRSHIEEEMGIVCVDDRQLIRDRPPVRLCLGF